MAEKPKPRHDRGVFEAVLEEDLFLSARPTRNPGISARERGLLRHLPAVRLLRPSLEARRREAREMGSRRLPGDPLPASDGRSRQARAQAEEDALAAAVEQARRARWKAAR